MPIQAILFDLDGLVIDSETGYLAAWQAAASRLGYCVSDDTWSQLRGCSASQLYVLLEASLADADQSNPAQLCFDRSEFSSLSSELWFQQVQQFGIPVKAGFSQLISRLKQLKLPYALVTNSGQIQAERALRLAGLSNVFEVLVAGDQLRQSKPAPDGYLLAAQRLQVDIADCLVLEDTFTGVQAAHRAGALCAYIPSQVQVDDKAKAMANWTLPDLSHVAEALSDDWRLSL